MTWVSISAITRTRSLEIGLDERLQTADKSHRVIIISEVEAFEVLGEFLDEKKREGMLVIMVIVLYCIGGGFISLEEKGYLVLTSSSNPSWAILYCHRLL